MCREEALDINALFAANGPLNEDTTQLIGIVKETAPTKQCMDDKCLGVGEFINKYFPRGTVYRDDNLLFYEALGKRSLLRNGFFGSFNPISIYREGKKLGKRLEEKGVDGNLKGEGVKLGGVLIFNSRGDVVYTHPEVTGKQFPVAEIADVINSIV